MPRDICLTSLGPLFQAAVPFGSQVLKKQAEAVKAKAAKVVAKLPTTGREPRGIRLVDPENGQLRLIQGAPWDVVLALNHGVLVALFMLKLHPHQHPVA